MKRITIISLIALSLLSACNTLSGIGEDLRISGEGLKNIAGGNNNNNGN